ncbi:MAG: hypothetical protein LWW77_09885, partial [Propionibacteriales bacterium]|nr:hypothetical protein [Propionibacteriales bacterium]
MVGLQDKLHYSNFPVDSFRGRVVPDHIHRSAPPPELRYTIGRPWRYLLDPRGQLRVGSHGLVQRRIGSIEVNRAAALEEVFTQLHLEMDRVFRAELADGSKRIRTAFYEPRGATGTFECHA